MKKYIFHITVLILLSSALSCEKFLDEPKPTDELTSGAIFSSREGINAYLSGIFRRFRSQFVYTGTTATTDVGGIYSMYFARAMKGNDLIQAVSWYRFDYDHSNREPTYRRVYVTWQYLYNMVMHANTIITEVAKSSLPDSEKKEFIAQGKALRAFFYFQLALEYQAAYPVNPNAQAPPLYTEPTSIPKGMSTMKQMYEQILSDVNDAIKDLPESRLGKSYINKQVANGLKAKILMAMNTGWPEIETAARAAYGGNVASSLDAASWNKGFTDINNKEWIWGMDQQSDQTNYYYLAPHAFTDHKRDSYTATFVNTTFVSKFSATDVRNTFENLYGAAPGHWTQFVTNKFEFSFESDVPLMRTAEMILIETEALYHQGKTTQAHDLLFNLQKNRDPQAVKSTNSGSALLEEILLERRKELYGELDIEWFDAKRLQRGITRNGNHRVMVTLTPNDKRFLLKIPQSEIDSNPEIDNDVNSNR
jgi:hypothetical protein